MDFEDIANIADLVAAFGVIASLVFLTIELRHSNQQAQLANWRALLDSLREFKAANNDPAFADLIERGGYDYHALSVAEKRSFGMYLEQGIHVYGNFTKHNDTVPKKLTGLEDAIRNSMSDLLATPGGRAWWAESRLRGRLMPATIDTVDAILRNGGARAEE